MKYSCKAYQDCYNHFYDSELAYMQGYYEIENGKIYITISGSDFQSEKLHKTLADQAAKENNTPYDEEFENIADIINNAQQDYVQKEYEELLKEYGSVKQAEQQLKKLWGSCL